MRPLTLFSTRRGGLRSARLCVLLSMLFSLIGVAAALTWRTPGRRPISLKSQSDLEAVSAAMEASRDQVEQTCGSCHAFPPPELFPKAGWPHEVERGFDFLRKASAQADTPSFASVVAYYQRRAPDLLPVLQQAVPPHECPARFERTGYRPTRGLSSSGIANVRFAHLSDARKLDIVACDMVNGKVFVVKPYERAAELRIVADAIPHPAHAEVVDLNRDGIKDMLVANLGSAVVTDDRVGSVVWLEGMADGSFTPVTLAAGLGRVTDAQAADFDGDGDLDVVVAEFGWMKSGRILMLENRLTDANPPQFILREIDPRHGAINVPVTDLNGDGRPDFVALISQEHETIVAFRNDGLGRFRPEVIFAAPHPAFGSSGIQLVDLDRDGDQDVLLANGDSTDNQMLRPYHGVQWLENQGSYPFPCHQLTSLYGVHRAVAGDLDGDGDLDIAAVSFLPGGYYRRLSREMNLDAIIVLEQTTPGQFVRHSLETVTCDHSTCDLGDFDADGKLDLVTANLLMPYGNVTVAEKPDADWVILRKNLGRPESLSPPRSATIPPR